MDAIRPAPPTPPVAQASGITPIRPVAGPSNGPDSRVLDPAVSIDVRPEASEAKPAQPEQRAYVRDQDSASLVFRVTDPKTGDVVMQIPTEVVLRARAYARETTTAFSGERLVKTA
ncbi:flagellar protein FlaG [Methylorubrum salsuginis]|uniref:FlaG protein n=1 Tax=Methylorubrum salsuginis TaxID=414703 RepID=A0A1I4GHX8_9HYPH|nr:flagellar protein FlaG [Methylorubrum salsuginis]SFL29479.1 FlaG protein [Methylorubrum salsuginis]